MTGDRLQVSVKVRFLTPGDGLVDQCGSVVELLGSLDWLFWVQSVEGDGSPGYCGCGEVRSPRS